MKMPGDRTVEDKTLYIYERQSEMLAYIDLSNSTTYHGNAVQSHFLPSWTLSIQNIRRSPHLKIVAHLLLQNLCVAYSSSYLSGIITKLFFIMFWWIISEYICLILKRIYP